MIGFVASIVEAYGEFRVNKGRILLSLVGVAFSVFAMTAVLGGGRMMTNALQQTLERDTGRQTVLSIQPAGGPSGGAATADSAERRDQVVLDVFDRLGITHRSRSFQTQVRAQTHQGVQAVQTNAVDPSYAEMYRLEVDRGRWLADTDRQRLAPAVVIDDRLYSRLGRPELGSATMTAYGTGQDSVQMVVVGVLPPRLGAEDHRPLTAFVHAGAAAALPGLDPATVMPTYLAWVPPEASDSVQQQIRRQLANTPYGSFEAFPMGISLEDVGFRQIEWALLGIAGVILLLGAMGLVNISLVTVRYRMREIGIRRSYGATGLRIFVGVLMESVVATVIAGAVGVTAAVALVRAPFVLDFFRDQGLVDLPPFPVFAVLVGLGAATTVGALAGIIPALIATRVKVIDAIRA